MASHKITLIGVGNLGKSILTGLLSSNFVSTKNITIVEKFQPKALEIEKQFNTNVTTDIAKGIEQSKYIIVCVQPAHINGVLEALKPHLQKDQVIISTVTSRSIQDISDQITGQEVIRVMPNTGASKLKSMTTIAGKNTNSENLKVVQEMFNTIGKTLVIEEHLMQAATVLGASGIAFFLRFLRAMTQGGIQMGFHPHEAQLIALQTAIGASTLVEENNTHPECEIDKVTTPRGCTIEGLNEMEHQGLSSSVIKGIMASFEKINAIKNQ